MRTLRLVALSDDGKRVVLAADAPDGADSGERFEVVIDDRLRAAARGDARQLGQMPNTVSSSLSPRVIQARIRSGETPEQVAESSGTQVERILRFAYPVLQERQRVAEQSRDARVRLSEGTTGTPLQQFMAERLRLVGADVEAVEWDARRTESGTWEVIASWRSDQKSGTTLWNYDLPARTVTPVDAATMDFAEGTRLVRVVPDVPTGIAARPTRQMSVLRRAEEPEPRPAAEEPSVPAPAARDRDDDPLSDDSPDEHDTVVLGRTDDAPGDGESADPRASIPAWEDIVFGVRRHR